MWNWGRAVPGVFSQCGPQELDNERRQTVAALTEPAAGFAALKMDRGFGPPRCGQCLLAAQDRKRSMPLRWSRAAGRPLSVWSVRRPPLCRVATQACRGPADLFGLPQKKSRNAAAGALPGPSGARVARRSDGWRAESAFVGQPARPGWKAAQRLFRSGHRAARCRKGCASARDRGRPGFQPAIRPHPGPAERPCNGFRQRRIRSDLGRSGQAVPCSAGRRSVGVCGRVDFRGGWHPAEPDGGAPAARGCCGWSGITALSRAGEPGRGAVWATVANAPFGYAQRLRRPAKSGAAGAVLRGFRPAGSARRHRLAGVLRHGDDHDSVSVQRIGPVWPARRVPVRTTGNDGPARDGCKSRRMPYSSATRRSSMPDAGRETAMRRGRAAVCRASRTVGRRQLRRGDGTGTNR